MQLVRHLYLLNHYSKDLNCRVRIYVLIQDVLPVLIYSSCSLLFGVGFSCCLALTVICSTCASVYLNRASVPSLRFVTFHGSLPSMFDHFLYSSHFVFLPVPCLPNLPGFNY